jgi:hypothetical protein
MALPSLREERQSAQHNGHDGHDCHSTFHQSLLMMTWTRVTAFSSAPCAAFAKGFGGTRNKLAARVV